jgi:hypothetical protein
MVGLYGYSRQIYSIFISALHEFNVLSSFRESAVLVVGVARVYRYMDTAAHRIIRILRLLGSKKAARLAV